MNGVDVSHYQGIIKWVEVLKNNPHIDFVFIKATQGASFTDSMLSNNAAGVSAAKIPFSYYHFATLNDHNVKKDAEVEAGHFLTAISKLARPTLPLVLDIEAETPKIQLEDQDVLNWIKTFFSVLQSHGYNDYIIYSGTPFLNMHLPKDHNLGNIRLWLAAYTSRPEPILPNGWKDYYIWQYTDKGTVRGISGKCDLNKSKVALY